MKEITSFNIPIGVFAFNRPDLLEKVLIRVSEIKPKKLYLMFDGPRKDNPSDLESVEKCKEMATKLIDWPCLVKKRFHENNVGVYENIALGAKWVFSMEEMAIFLEDDNYPDTSFFYYCEQMLVKYKDENQVFIVFGNNFLINVKAPNNASYLFTQHLHPCGWASWQRKFIVNYDWEMTLWQDDAMKDKILNKIRYIPNKSRYFIAFTSELENYKAYGKFISWDFHCYLTLLGKDLLAIVPKTNLIKNIGVDERATHGAVEINRHTSIMVPQVVLPLENPLIHPDRVELDNKFEDRLFKLLRPSGFIFTYLYYYLMIQKIFGKWGKKLFTIILKIRLSLSR